MHTTRTLGLGATVAALLLGLTGCMTTPEGGSCVSDLNCQGAMVCEDDVCVDWGSDYDYDDDDGTSGGCGGSYGGPYYDDYQVESQCQAIYASGCSAEATEAGCEILDGWAANGVPNVCPYC